MAARYYYFRSTSFELTEIQARVPPGAALVSVLPEITESSFVVVSCDDAFQEDLITAMSDFGFAFVDSTLVVPPAFGSARDFGVLGAAPTVPVPAAGDRYFDTSFGALSYTGAAWRGVQTFEIPFTFATASPLVVTPLRTTDRVMRSDVYVDVAFDGVGAAVSLGSAANPTGIFVPQNIDLSNTISPARSFDIFQVGALSNLQLGIVPGAGATQGAGRVFLEIWRAS